MLPYCITPRTGVACATNGGRFTVCWIGSPGGIRKHKHYAGIDMCQCTLGAVRASWNAAVLALRDAARSGRLVRLCGAAKVVALRHGRKSAQLGHNSTGGPSIRTCATL